MSEGVPQAVSHQAYPATFGVDYQEKLSRVTTLFRSILIIPIAIILGIIASGPQSVLLVINDQGEIVSRTTNTGSGILWSLFAATLFMILFRKRYPKWWFDFNVGLHRFAVRVVVYFGVLTDKYPSTEDDQNVHLDVTYPNAQTDLSRGMPLVKWFLAIPHYFILAFLWVAVFGVTVVAWIIVIITGRYPRGLFNFVVGVLRWSWRVQAYAFVLATDKYPPFSLNE